MKKNETKKRTNMLIQRDLTQDDETKKEKREVKR